MPEPWPGPVCEKRRGSRGVLIALLIVGLITGGVLGYFFCGAVGYFPRYAELSDKIGKLEDEVSALRQQVHSLLKSAQSVPVDLTLKNESAFSWIYEEVRESVVVIKIYRMSYSFWGDSYYALYSQGSGFVYNHSGMMVIITNYHVVENAVVDGSRFTITVTFIDGEEYPARALGYDVYSDLAVLAADAPRDKLKPLVIESSSTLNVGDVVIAIGNPYGLAGSMSVGVVSALGRTLVEDQTGGYAIPNVIQTTAPLNPGNSGGPLVNLRGSVVGITTAIVSDSQGLGFAIPSNTILKEIGSLVSTGRYEGHPWMGISGVDMNYPIAKMMGVNVTYGVLITRVTPGGPADKAGIKGGTKQVYFDGRYIEVGGDIIIAIDGVKVTNFDFLVSYLEEYTVPGQTVELTVLRGGRAIDVPVTIGKRPLPTS
ncbi:MAG: trypsin-like peptidase domain-containing protein [Candidatus Nezhaarchaeota archaeon]|nr:trypsin-like peptidase domain-containing protein [Candidatus Nezhaarchaeota archaeon]